MKILHISTRLILGGSQENTVLSCEGQARLGHEVHLAFGPVYGPEGSLVERVEAFGKRCEMGLEKTLYGGPCKPVAIHVVSSLVREINPVADLRCYFQLKRLIREIKPDVVHTHSSKAGIIGRAAAWAEGARGKGIGVVHTIHGPPFHKYLPRRTNVVYTVAERFAAKRCHVLVSVADAMTEQYLARGVGRAEQYVTVHSGMETEQYLDAAPGQGRDEIRARLGLADDDFVIGTVARLAEFKGHDDLLDGLGEELRAHENWKLLWVGDGWWKERLLKRVEEMGLKDQVVTTGLVSPDRVPGLIRAMDVLAHPSYREGLPRTVPQALLCGVCPVAYDVDGTREVCRDMETGRLVAAGDSGALRDAIVWLGEHAVEREEMARRGREMCREMFCARRMVERLEEVYCGCHTSTR